MRSLLTIRRETIICIETMPPLFAHMDVLVHRQEIQSQREEANNQYLASLMAYYHGSSSSSVMPLVPPPPVEFPHGHHQQIHHHPKSLSMTCLGVSKGSFLFISLLYCGQYFYFKFGVLVILPIFEHYYTLLLFLSKFYFGKSLSPHISYLFSYEKLETQFWFVCLFV